MTTCFLLFLGLSSLFAQKDIDLEEIWIDYRFFPTPVSSFEFLNDGERFTRLIDNSINAYSIRSGKKTDVIYKGDRGFSGYSFSADEQKILIETNRESIYRYSTRADFYVWDREKEQLETLDGLGKQMYATFNPEGTKVAYVRENNLFIKDLQTGQKTIVTTDGKQNEIINGATDWVYEEEFAIDKAFFWSPDGTKIAFLRFDETEVREYSMMYYNDDTYPKPYTFKYPKAGESNSIVTAHIFDLKTKKTVTAEIGPELDQYIPRLTWTKDSWLCITRLNRLQNKLDLLLIEPSTGKKKTLLIEKNEYYIDIHDHLTFLEDGEHFVWLSEQDGYNHLYLYNMDGEVEKQLTEGKYDVTSVYGVDEKRGRVYFQAAMRSPLERELYYVKLKGGKPTIIGDRPGTHSAQFSTTFDFFVHRYSRADLPPQVAVRNHRGKELRMIEDNSAFQNRLKQYNLSPMEFITCPAADGETQLNAWMVKPPNFDANKEYPLFMFVYGGPGSQTVNNSWGARSNYAWFQMLAQQGYIVVSVDNRGTGARGEVFKKMTYKELGKYEAEDQIAAAKYLGGKEYIDSDRIGIFGWSFGGYLSSLCLAKGADVFKMAIAVAPVTNWKWYDTIYTERYMQKPQNNDDGYEDNSPVNFAGEIRGKYLLVHGLADDNVHFQHSAEMAKALVNNNISFEQQFYTNRAHGIFGGFTRLHLYRRMTSFVKDNL